MKYLLDTNVISEAMKSAGEMTVISWIDENDDQCALSSISLGEIERGLALLPAGRRKQELQSAFEALLDTVEERILPFDAEAARAWARLTTSSQRHGRQLPVLDSMIEAIAVHWDLTIVTRNTSDFIQAPTLNPWPVSR